MKIEVLGSGCPSCKKMYEITQEVVESLTSNIELEYVTGIEGTQRIIELGAISSPVVAVDGKIALTGYSPDKKAITQAILKTAKQE